MTRLTRFIAVAVAAVMVAALGPLARASADEIPAHPSSLKACQNLRAGTFNNMLLNGRFTLEVYRGTVEINHSVPINGPRPDVYLSHSWLQMDYRANQPVGDATYLAFYCNGDLALRHENGSLIWHSNTAGRGGARVSLSSGGNLAIYTAAGQVVWQSGSGASAMATNSVLRSNSRLITISNFLNEPPSTLAMQTDGNLVYRNGSKVAWQTKTRIPGSHAGLTTKAQLVVVSPAGKILWASRPAGTSASVLALDAPRITQYQPTEKILWWFNT